MYILKRRGKDIMPIAPKRISGKDFTPKHVKLENNPKELMKSQ